MPAVQNAQIVDLEAYRAARRQPVSAEGKTASFAAVGPVVMMVPVWAFFPMVPGAWVYAG